MGWGLWEKAYRMGTQTGVGMWDGGMEQEHGMGT